MTERADNGRQVNAAMREIIHLDDQTGPMFSQNQETFVADLAYQCSNLLNWSAQPTQSILLQQTIWKNEMRKKASDQYPELDNEEIRRLVDRDWKVMNESSRNIITKEYSKCLNPGQLQSRAEDLRERIFLAKESKKQ